jgi:hypothetical protein
VAERRVSSITVTYTCFVCGKVVKRKYKSDKDGLISVPHEMLCDCGIGTVMDAKAEKDDVKWRTK